KRPRLRKRLHRLRRQLRLKRPRPPKRRLRLRRPLLRSRRRQARRLRRLRLKKLLPKKQQQSPQQRKLRLKRRQLKRNKGYWKDGKGPVIVPGLFLCLRLEPEAIVVRGNRDGSAVGQRAEEDVVR